MKILLVSPSFFNSKFGSSCKVVFQMKLKEFPGCISRVHTTQPSPGSA